MQGGRIFYKNATTGALNQLESDSSTQALMDYFNPTLADVETQELTCAARMVHWATNDADHRRVQVETAIEHFKANMIVYNTQLHLNGVPAKVCQVICDVLHQGRGTYARIAASIATGGDWEKAYSNLLQIGNTNYAERISTVKATITSLVNQGVFNKTYNAATNSFV